MKMQIKTFPSRIINYFKSLISFQNLGFILMMIGASILVGVRAYDQGYYDGMTWSNKVCVHLLYKKTRDCQELVSKIDLQHALREYELEQRLHELETKYHVRDRVEKLFFSVEE